MAKSIVLIVIIVTIFAVDIDGQAPPNPLFHSQDAINYYHELYDEMKMTIQGYMAGYIRDITDEVLEILTSTMDTWRRQHRALPRSEMFRKLVNLRSSTEIGEMIRQCTSDVFWLVSEHQEYAFYDLEEWQEYSTGLLTSVVLKLGDYDIVGRLSWILP
uniref:Uncharacterized protein n=1 Tax=Phlebotomus papatasi TaxID=29031 RepID=A0A1B0DKL3_PHLPP